MRHPGFPVLTSCSMFAALVLSGAWAADGNGSYLPGGEEVKKAVEARRGKTELSKLAASMKPGTWAELKTKVPKGLWASPKWKGGRGKPGGSGGLHIGGWTSDAHWDSRTGQLFFMGLRQTRRFIAYSEEKNEWRSIELDPMSDNPVFRTRYGHVYGTNGFDPERSRFYHYYRAFQSKAENIDLKGGVSYFDALTEKWTKLPGGLGAMTLEYFTAMDGLILLGKKPRFFNTKKQKTEQMGASPVDGYHSLMRHNPFRQEVLMGGGNNNPSTVARFTKDGKIEKLKSFPHKLSVRGDKLTVDPQTGRYLLFQFGHFKGDKKIYAYEFDSDKNEWRVVEKAAAAFPWSYYKRPYTVSAFIPEHNVIMFANGSVHLYKHDPNGKYPLVSDAPAKTTPPKKGK